MPNPAPNRNTFYAQMFVDAVVRAGLGGVCIAPGSRSTPLTLAFAEREKTHADVRVYSHLDERSAAFFALGLAMASDVPTAIVCTSGTAAANFYPAIIEAYMSRVPLLVFTADRPYELRHSGANQTIDQVKMYGDHVLWAVDMALPEATPPAVVIRNWRTMAARAFAAADGRMAWRRKGPVHLNFPFRKPLEPIWVAGDEMPTITDSPVEFEYIGETEPAGEHTQWIEFFREHERGVVICGGGRHDERFIEDIALFGAIYGYPILAEPLSGMRFRNHDNRYGLVVSGYDNFMGALPDELQAPDVIIRLGAVPTSKALNEYIAGATEARVVTISRDGVWQDDAHRTTHRLHLRTLRHLMPFPHDIYEVRDSDWMKGWARVEHVTRRVIETVTDGPFFDGGVVAAVVGRLGDGSHLFVGNSNAIRHVEQFTMTGTVTHHVYASRGASGIDGQVSTALGVAAATGEHIYAILGDITFYHDMNGLLAVRRNGVSGTFIVINNNGGGIFERLPIREFEPYHTEQFLTPHGLTFEHAAAMYSLAYSHVTDFVTLAAALDRYMRPGVSAIIEVQTDIKTDEARRKAVIRQVWEGVGAM